jgi:hypothetical protein
MTSTGTARGWRATWTRTSTERATEGDGRELNDDGGDTRACRTRARRHCNLTVMLRIPPTTQTATTTRPTPARHPDPERRVGVHVAKRPRLLHDPALPRASRTPSSAPAHGACDEFVKELDIGKHVIHDRLAGKSVAVICEKYGISERALEQWMVDFNSRQPPVPKTYRDHPQITNEAILAIPNVTTMRLDEVALIYDVPPGLIRQRLDDGNEHVKATLRAKLMVHIRQGLSRRVMPADSVQIKLGRSTSGRQFSGLPVHRAVYSVAVQDREDDPLQDVLGPPISSAPASMLEALARNTGTAENDRHGQLADAMPADSSMTERPAPDFNLASPPASHSASELQPVPWAQIAGATLQDFLASLMPDASDMSASEATGVSIPIEEMIDEAMRRSRDEYES